MFGMMLGMMERWMPLDARRHVIAARRERLLAVRAWLDRCIEGTEPGARPEAPPEAARPPSEQAPRGRRRRVSVETGTEPA